MDGCFQSLETLRDYSGDKYMDLSACYLIPQNSFMNLFTSSAHIKPVEHFFHLSLDIVTSCLCVIQITFLLFTVLLCPSCDMILVKPKHVNVLL